MDSEDVISEDKEMEFKHKGFDEEEKEDEEAKKLKRARLSV